MSKHRRQDLDRFMQTQSWWQGEDLAVVVAEQAIHVLGVQGAVAALEGGHGGRPEVVRAARVAVYARQAVAHPQRHVQRLLQLALRQNRVLSNSSGGALMRGFKAGCFADV